MLLAAVGCLSVLTNFAVAGDWDGSQPLSGITEKVVEVTPYRVDEGVDPDTVGLPQKFLIDFEAKLLRPSKDSRVTTSISFEGVDYLENKIVIQGRYEGVEGVEDGLAWNLTISRKNGKAVLSASGDGVAYVVFGTCTPTTSGSNLD